MRKTLFLLSLGSWLIVAGPVYAQNYLDLLLNPGQNDARYEDNYQRDYQEASQNYQRADDQQLRQDRRRLRAAENRVRAAERALDDEMNRRGMRD